MAYPLHAHVGDLIVIEGHRLGDSRRIGEILEVLDAARHEHYRVRWDDDRVSIFTPGTDATIKHIAHPEDEPVLNHEP